MYCRLRALRSRRGRTARPKSGGQNSRARVKVSGQSPPAARKSCGLLQACFRECPTRTALEVAGGVSNTSMLLRYEPNKQGAPVSALAFLLSEND